jgi:hypothetical protein
MVFAKFSERGCVTATNRTEQILGLVAKLIEIGTNREVAIVELLWHTDLLLGHARGPLASGEKEVRTEPLF